VSDNLHLSGPDANMEKDNFMAEQERANNMDASRILELLNKTFVQEPKKTIDAMSIEETLQHKYVLEETVRSLRVHLFVIDKAERKHKTKISDKIFKDLDKNYKPKPVPASRQATNDFEKLVQELMDKSGCTREDAVEFLK